MQYKSQSNAAAVFFFTIVPNQYVLHLKEVRNVLKMAFEREKSSRKIHVACQNLSQ